MLAQGILDPVPVGHAEFAPLGDQQEGVRAGERLVGVAGVGDSVLKLVLGLFGSDGVVGGYGGSERHQGFGNDQGGSLAHVVGLRLEAKSPHGKVLAAKVCTKMSLDLGDHDALLGVVDRLDGFEDAHGIALLLGGAGQGLDVLGEAASAVANARVNKLGADARIAADALAYLVHVGPHDFAEVGDVVHERNLGGQHGIGGVLGHFCRRNVHKQHRVPVEGKGFVEAAQYLLRPLRLHAADDAVWPHKVVDGCAFFEKLRVGGHVKGQSRTAGVQCRLESSTHLFGRSHRHRTLGNDYEVVIDAAADAFGYRQDVLQVGTAVLSRRSSHGDECGL